MVNSREYILNRLRSKRVSIEEFNYDKLQAPPLSMFFSPYDIQQLNSIARSIKYSAKPKEKYEAIDKIMRSRGLVKFAAGTNRVVYRHPEFNDILFKIAYDDVGLGDNPAEFRNQFLLKPFCAKMFEVSPCGTIAIVERVNPIQSREELLSVADDIFELLTEFIIGKYVIADCGSRYFMNFGVRSTFGLVVIDYPYVYEVDGSKLYCSKPDPNSPSGKCDGEIDYDDGFNFLVCKKCGAVYKAKELEKKIANNELVVARKGEISMEITITGGSKNLNEKIVTGSSVNAPEFRPTRNNTPVAKKAEKANKLDITVSRSSSTKVEKEDDSKWYVNGVSTEPLEEATVEEVVDEATKNMVEAMHVATKEVDTETLVYDALHIDQEVIPVEEETEVEEKVEVEVPVAKLDTSIDTRILKTPFRTATQEEIEEAQEELAKEEEGERTPGRIIDDALASIDDYIDELGIDIVKNDIIKRMLDIVNDHVKPSVNSIGVLLDILYAMFDKLSDEEKNQIIKDNNLVNFIFGKMYNASLEVANCEVDEKNIVVDYNININSSLDEEDEDGIEVLATVDDLQLTLENAAEIAKSLDDSVDKHSEGSYDGVDMYYGKVMKVSEIIPDIENDRDVIAIVNKNTNNYEAIDGKIILVDSVDDYAMSDLRLVTKAWFDTAVEEIADDEDEVELETVEEEVLEESDMPVGVVSPEE